jgi:DMSO reductase anchor subunit
MNSNTIITSFKYYGIAALCGFIAVHPFVILSIQLNVSVNWFYMHNTSLSYTIITLVAFIVGLLCLELSVSIEDWFDRKIASNYTKIIREYEDEKALSEHIKNWYLYLLQSPTPNEKKIIYKHIDYLVERLKFTTSLLVALTSFNIGHFLLNCLNNYFRVSTTILFVVLAVLLCYFLYNRIYTLTKHLSYLRKKLLDTQNN